VNIFVIKISINHLLIEVQENQTPSVLNQDNTPLEDLGKYNGTGKQIEPLDQNFLKSEIILN
jgi:hypothetical protein